MKKADNLCLEYLGKTTSAVVGMELKYPDDEKKKNSVCISLDIPETPEDYFISAQTQNKVEELVRSELAQITVMLHDHIVELCKQCQKRRKNFPT